MMSLCKDCKFLDECQPKKENDNIYGCSYRGAFDKNGDYIDTNSAN